MCNIPIWLLAVVLFLAIVCLQSVVPGLDMTKHFGVIILILGLYFGLLIYFTPTFVALRRNTIDNFGIFFLNLILGFTILGWFLILLWAIISPKLIVEGVDDRALRKFKRIFRRA